LPSVSRVPILLLADQILAGFLGSTAVFQTEIQRLVGVAHVFQPLFLDVSSVEKEQNTDRDDNRDAVDHVSFL
jgi:ATP-dependent protease HslVU (ClpYQ) peptidase subunit